MALEVFKLIGSIMVDSSEADKSLSKTEEQAEGVASKLASGAKGAVKFGAAVTGAAVAAGTALIGAAKSTATDLDTIDKASQRMGITAESYQELAYAAELSGVEMSTMEKAAKKLEGTDINFDDAIASIMALSTEEERSAAAADLFGESIAYSLTPFLNQGEEGLSAMKEEAHNLGLVMSNESVAAGAQMNDSFTKVQESISSLVTMIMVEVMPYVQETLDWIVTHMPEIKECIGDVVEKVKPILTGLIDFVSGIFTGDWQRAWQGVQDIFRGIWEGMKTIFREPINWIIGKLNTFIAGVNRIQIPSWVPGIGGYGMNISSIPYLANGGVLEKGQTGFLEGTGAEAVVPLENNKKWISAVAEDMEAGIGGAEVVALLDDILDAIKEVANSGIYLNGKTLVGGIARDMDSELGRISQQRIRGLV